MFSFSDLSIDAPITPEKLREVASRERAKYAELIIAFPPGTYNEARNRSYDLADIAEKSANLMAEKGINSTNHFGPFNVFSPKRKEKVVVKAGSEIFSTHPTVKQRNSSRRQTVTIHSLDNGFVRNEDGVFDVRMSRVHWAGTGGYWCWTDLSNVEPVPA